MKITKKSSFDSSIGDNSVRGDTSDLFVTRFGNDTLFSDSQISEVQQMSSDGSFRLL